MKKIAIVLLISTSLLACKQKKEDIIVNRWRAVALENPDMDTLIRNQQIFIDTVGTHTDAAANKELYGVDNLDSLKQALQGELEGFKAMQQESVTSSVFDFMKGGKAVINFGEGNVDSCKWYFDDDGALILDEMKMKGAGDKIKMEVLMLTDTMMKLRLNEQGSKSTVTFKPEKK